MNGTKIIYAVLAVIVLGVVAVFALQDRGVPAPTANTSDVSNWKTYRNEQYGFEFRYPSLLVLKDKEDVAKDVIVLRRSNSAQGTEGPSIFIGVNLNPDYLSLEEYYDGNPGGELMRDDVFGETANQVKTDNVATRFSSIPTGDAVAIFSRGGYFLTMSDIGNSFQSSGVFDQILSTFKFTK